MASLSSFRLASWLGQALAHNTVLKTLTINGNHIGDRGAEHICAGLRTNDNLIELNLCGNQVGDIGAAALARLVAPGGHPALVKLDLRHNDLSDAGFASVASAIADGGRLTSLDLRYNHSATEVGIAHLAKMLETNFTVLTLALDASRYTGRINKKLAKNREWVFKKADREVEIKALYADGDIDKKTYLDQMEELRRGGVALEEQEEDDTARDTDVIEERQDPRSGRLYYQNMRTRKTSWYREDVEERGVVVVAE